MKKAESLFLLTLAVLIIPVHSYSAEKIAMAFATGDYLYEYWSADTDLWLDVSGLPWQHYEYIIEHSAKITTPEIDCAENNFIAGTDTVLCLEGLYPYCGFGKSCGKETIFFLPEVISHKKVILSLTVKHGDNHGHSAPIEEIVDKLPGDALLVDNMVKFLAERGYAGINIDFENFDDSAAGTFKNFVIQLKTAMTKADPSLLLLVDIQPGSLRAENKTAFRAALGELAANGVFDFWLFMGYDYFTSPDTPVGPWFRNNGVCVRDDLARLAAIAPSDRIVYLLPFHIWCQSCPDSLAPWRTVVNIPVVEQYPIHQEYLEKFGEVRYTVRGVDHNVGQYFNDADCLRQKIGAALLDYPELAGFGAWEIAYDLDNGSLSRAIRIALSGMSPAFFNLLLD